MGGGEGGELGEGSKLMALPSAREPRRQEKKQNTPSIMNSAAPPPPSPPSSSPPPRQKACGEIWNAPRGVCTDLRVFHLCQSDISTPRGSASLALIHFFTGTLCPQVYLWPERRAFLSFFLSFFPGVQ